MAVLSLTAISSWQPLNWQIPVCFRREEQLSSQHATELANQREYMQRAEHELCKKHALQLKQQPKSLKVRGNKIWIFSIHTKLTQIWNSWLIFTFSVVSMAQVVCVFVDE